MPQTAKRARVARTPAKRMGASRQYDGQYGVSAQPAQSAPLRQPAARSTRSAGSAGSAGSAAKVRTFAPRTRGAAPADPPAAAAATPDLQDLAPDLAPRPLASAGHGLGHGLARCPGCALTPWPECACCGAPTVYALDAGGAESDAGDLAHAHALTLCAACHALLLEARDPRAEPLRYLPLTTLQTKQAQRPKNGQTAKQPQSQTQRPTQPKRPAQLQAKQPTQPAQRTPRKRTQRAKSSANGGAA